MTRYCEDCRHWKRADPLDEGEFPGAVKWTPEQRARTHEYVNSRGECDRAHDVSSLAKGEVDMNGDVSMVKSGALKLRSWMQTNQHFGCIQWQSK